jgi:hypothetical protein
MRGGGLFYFSDEFASWPAVFPAPAQHLRPWPPRTNLSWRLVVQWYYRGEGRSLTSAGQSVTRMSQFFTQLINVIPPEFYMPQRDEDEEDPVRRVAVPRVSALLTLLAHLTTLLAGAEQVRVWEEEDGGRERGA